MKKFSHFKIVIVCFFCLINLAVAQPFVFSSIPNKRYYKSMLDINQLKVSITNYNAGSAYPFLGTFYESIYWPGGRFAEKPLIRTDGLQWGGKFDSLDYRINYSSYTPSLQPGIIFGDGSPDDPLNGRYKIYRLLKGWEQIPFGEERDQYENDYNEWPVENGAPWEDIDGDGIFSRGIDKPEIFGDQTLFYVANDLDTFWHKIHSGTLPLGLEIQGLIYGFNRNGLLGDVFFRKYRIINKNTIKIDSFIVSINVSPWLRENKNYAGCDTSLDLGFLFSSQSYDPIYKDDKPAIGYLILEYSLNRNSIKRNEINFMNSFMVNIIYPLNQQNDTTFYRPYFPKNYFERWHNLTGKLPRGFPFRNPLTGEITKFVAPGDPDKRTGWYERDGWPGWDTVMLHPFRGMNLNLTPVTFNSYDTVEVVFATIAAKGADNLKSVTELKKRAAMIKKLYAKNFQLTPLPPKPKVHSYSSDSAVTLWWESNAEAYDEIDELILEQNYPDTTYTFEGYIIRQHKDTLDSEGRIVKIIDRRNGISTIEDYTIANGVSVRLPILHCPNEGITRYAELREDRIRNTVLYNGSDYYYSVSSFAYSAESSPVIIESEREIKKVIPGRKKIDYRSRYEKERSGKGKQTEGESDAEVGIIVVDGESITGATYRVEFKGQKDSLRYRVINKTRGDTLYGELKQTGKDSIEKHIFDGLYVTIENHGQDSIDKLGGSRMNGIKSITSEGENVFNNRKGNEGWEIKGKGNNADGRTDINFLNNAGYGRYKLKKSESGSEYYTTGYSAVNPLTKDDPKGKGRIPIEAYHQEYGKQTWDRMLIKVWDKELRDTSWSRDSVSGEYEALYLYKGNYTEPLASSSGTGMSYKIGNIVIKGEGFPKEGAEIEIETFKPLKGGDVYEIETEKAELNDRAEGKRKLGELSVFPNPYYAGNNDGGMEKVRFTGMAKKSIIRMYSISGVFVRKLSNETEGSQYIDWDLRNEWGEKVGSGMYIAYVEIEGIGTRVMKIAVIQAKEYLDRQ